MAFEVFWRLVPISFICLAVQRLDGMVAEILRLSLGVLSDHLSELHIEL